MKILALEFSSPQRSAAVVWGRAPDQLAESEVVESGPGGTRALALVEEALRAAKVEREQIDCLAIGIGPGSYTGIRAAIALAQGWQLARGPARLKLLGISSAEALAALAQEKGLYGRVGVVIDAQRDEFYLAHYEVSQAECRLLEPLRLAGIVELREREQTGGLLVGPEVTRCFSRGRLLFPGAATLGKLALRGGNFVDGEKLEPIYLRETSFVKSAPGRVFRS